MRWMLALLVCGCGAAHAQVNPPAVVAPTDVLAGPKVGGADKAATPDVLVERDFDGKVRRLDTSVEEAALEHIDLSSEERSRVEAIFAERAALIDKLVRENLRTLMDAAAAGQAGDRQGQSRAVRELISKAGELGERGRLRDQIVKVIDPAKADQLRMITDAYWNAIVEETQKADAQQRGARTRALAREFLLGVGQEIRRSYERSIVSKGAELDAALARLNLGEEKTTRVRNQFTDYGQKNLLNKATPEDRRAFIQKLAQELGPDEFRALLREVFGAEVPARAERP